MGVAAWLDPLGVFTATAGRLPEPDLSASPPLSTLQKVLLGAGALVVGWVVYRMIKRKAKK